MGIIRSILARRLWYEWSDKFTDRPSYYITPKDHKLMGAVRDSGMLNEETDLGKARAAHKWVYNNISYRLSEKWKTPNETLSDGIGDCEDVTFLIASMLSASGVKEQEIAIGVLKYSNGQEEFHTWNEVDNQVIDATGAPERQNGLTYSPSRMYKVVTEVGKNDKSTKA